MDKALAIGAAGARGRALADHADVVAQPGAEERAGRTFMCAVLFLDLIEYARKPVAEQLQVKERFNAQLAEAIEEVPVEDRIVLDTGDGVAVSFLGHPEDALFVALRVADLLTASKAPDAAIRTRAGINFGPVRLASDSNDQPAVVGDGINVAQRIMAFAGPGQVLLSRSYQEAVTRISREYQKLFTYQGSRTDEHIREHEIYHFDPADRAVRALAERLARARPRTPALRRLARTALRLLRAPRAAPIAATLSVMLLIGAVGLHWHRAHVAGEHADASDKASDGTIRPGARGAAKSARGSRPRSAATKEGQAAAVWERGGSELTGEARSDATPAATTPWAIPRTSAAPSTHASAGARPHPAGLALVTLAISPWGEVYVDGKAMGVSPPLSELELAQGKHRIVVRNSRFKPYEQDVAVGSNETLKIKHKFSEPR